MRTNKTERNMDSTPGTVSRRCALPTLAATLLFLAAAFVTQLSHAVDLDFSVEREKYKRAERALKSGDLDRFHKLSEELRDYPLYRYLRYKQLRKYMSHNSDRTISEFLTTYEGSRLTRKLRRAKLRSLAKRKQWQRYLNFYRDPQPVKLQCHKLRAELATGRGKDFSEKATQLWLVGNSQPDACDLAFDFLYDNGLITSSLLWSRIGLAMDKGNTRLAGVLAKRLSRSDRNWFEIWKQMHRKPSRTLRHPDLKTDTKVVRSILRHGIRRKARTDVTGAKQAWDSIENQYAFSKPEARKLENYIAMRAVYRRDPNAHQWLSELHKKAHTEKSREWQVRTTLANGDWDATLRSIASLPPSDQREPKWRYWQARAIAGLDQRAKANKLFGELAKDRSYFGFLAADRVKKPYELNSDPITANPGIIKKLTKIPGIQRARELFWLEKFVDARGEWYYATRDLSERKLTQAALLAHQWGWHDRAIITVAKTGHMDDLELRFPLAYKKEVTNNARHYGLDPAWILGMVRQESAFMKDARSSAGALGLMQLMPATGKETARQLNIPLRNKYQLLKADKNIRIGSGYLSKMLNRFDGNKVMAIAAYNAGPHRVERWQPRKKSQDPEVWAELIPYTETRKYVRRVLAYTAVFEWRLGDAITPMRDVMRPVPPRAR